MKVVKPIQMDDSILTSTITEPDTANGEIEWVSRSSPTPTGQGTPKAAESSSSGGYWFARFLTGVVVEVDDQFNFIRQLSQELAVDAIGVASDGSSLWVLNDTGSSWKVTEYNESTGLVTGTEVALPNETYCICYTGTSFAAVENNGGTIQIAEYSTAWVALSVPTIDIAPLIAPAAFDLSDITFNDGKYYLTPTTNDKAYEIARQTGELGDSATFAISGASSTALAVKSAAISALRFDPVLLTDAVNYLSTSPLLANVYTPGERRILTSTHRLYECVSATSDSPDVGSEASPQTWFDVGGSNKYAMFDAVIGSQSVADNSIVVDIVPGEVINSVSMFNIQADAVNITMTDPTNGEVYNKDIDMRDDSAVSDYYEYFFSPLVIRKQFSVTDLPAFPGATTTITATGAGEVKAGELVVGPAIDIGTTEYGTGYQLLNFNQRSRDEFGQFRQTTGRRTADLYSYDVAIPELRFEYVRNQIKPLVEIPCVWIGTDADGKRAEVYGYYSSFQVNWNNPSISNCTIEVQGLI